MFFVLLICVQKCPLYGVISMISCQPKDLRTTTPMNSNSGTRKDHLKLAKRGLRKGLNIFSPGTHINAKGYTESIADNLVSSVMPADFESDLKQGSGNEDSGKVRATHSSSALVVNCFGPFKRHLSDLQICGTEGLTSLHFEKKCPTYRPPWHAAKPRLTDRAYRPHCCNRI